jgi:uncharacterized damage-inducible protein DinB
MTISQQITLDYEDEMKNTRKLLERIPLDDAHRDFKPHPKSMAFDRLATHVAEIPAWPKIALDSEVLDIPMDFKPHIATSTAELLEIFDKNFEAGRGRLASATDAEMLTDWTLKFGGNTVSTRPRTKAIRSFINHLIHHRAQLGVYLRLNEIAVPGMYGPSADEH